MTAPDVLPYSADYVYRDLTGADSAGIPPVSLPAAATIPRLQDMARGFAEAIRGMGMPVDIVHEAEFANSDPLDRMALEEPIATRRRPAWVVVHDTNLSGEPLAEARLIEDIHSISLASHVPNNYSKKSTTLSLPRAEAVELGTWDELVFSESAVIITAFGELLTAGRSKSTADDVKNLEELREYPLWLNRYQKLSPLIICSERDIIHSDRVLKAMMQRMRQSRDAYDTLRRRELATGPLERPLDYYDDKTDPVVVGAPQKSRRGWKWKKH